MNIKIATLLTAAFAVSAFATKTYRVAIMEGNLEHAHANIEEGGRAVLQMNRVPPGRVVQFPHLNVMFRDNRPVLVDGAELLEPFTWKVEELNTGRDKTAERKESRYRPY